MKYEYIPIPQKNKVKRVATLMFFLGLATFALGGVKVIPFRVVLQIASLVAFTSAIMLVGKFLLRAYGYRIEDFGEGDEFVVNEITRATCVTVCRLELSKLTAVKKWSDIPKEEKSGRSYSYNYSPDPFSEDTYILEFFESNYDITGTVIRVRILPDEKLVSLLEGYVIPISERQGEEDNK